MMLKKGGELWLVLRLPVWTTFGFSWIDVSVTQSRSCWTDPEARTHLQWTPSGRRRVRRWLFILADTSLLTQTVMNWAHRVSGAALDSHHRDPTGQQEASMMTDRGAPLDKAWLSSAIRWSDEENKVCFFKRCIFNASLTCSCVSCPPGLIERGKCSYRYSHVRLRFRGRSGRVLGGGCESPQTKPLMSSHAKRCWNDCILNWI